MEHKDGSTFSLEASGVSIDLDTGEVSVDEIEISSDLSDLYIQTLSYVFDHFLQSIKVLREMSKDASPDDSDE